ncbi:MAG: hypothetical protein ACI8XZ_005202 [Gammaproteobacteria bacterium]|jgi:hypothetical protein
MNWDAVSAITEIVGASAVIATLFYLAVQIRQNTRITISNIREQRMGATQEIIFKWADEAGLLDKIERNEEIEGTERTRALMIIREVFRNWESHIHQHRNGLFEDEKWRAVQETMRYLFRSNLDQTSWADHRVEFSAYLQR